LTQPDEFMALFNKLLMLRGFIAAPNS
jgi:hypothetical protein